MRHKGFLPKKKWQTPFVWLQQALFLMKQIWQAKIIVCMFSGYHSFLPALLGKLFNRPCLIVAGGTDCVSFPSIGYGCFAKPLLSKFTRWSYQMAAHISPVHEKLVWQEYKYQPDDYPYQGFKYHCPDLKTPYTVIYNGYNADFWKPIETIIRKPLSFLTVCAGLDMQFTQRLKGVDLILEVASQLPDASFTIVGAPTGFKFRDKPENVQVLPKIPISNLKEVYSAHEFYLQLSMSEGFPNALSESMLCGCIPVVSKVGGMPEIIGKCGFILEKRDVNQLREVLLNAITSDYKLLGNLARDVVASNFTEEAREEKLFNLLKALNKIKN